MTCRILIVEDDNNMIEILKEAFSRLLVDCEVFPCGFADAAQKIAEILPDVAVLDIFEDQITGESINAVQLPLAYIWNQHFCPIVFHSAHPLEQFSSDNHPFVRCETKGGGSLDRVAAHIKEFAPEIDGLRAIRDELSRSIHETLVKVSPLIWEPGKSSLELTNKLLRAVRRRMAATLDHPAKPSEKLEAWEQYICPPIGKDLLTGDILLASSRDNKDPASYRLVLSPSCDLVIGRPNTLKQVLVAECVRVKKFVEKTRLPRETLVEELPRELTKDQVSGLMVLPAFSKVIPLMAANLRKLSLIPYADIAPQSGETKLFIRIANLDSPFRERLAWAYLQIAGRPGVPDVDVQSLAADIDQAIKASTKA